MNDIIKYDHPFLTGRSFEQREFGFWTTNVARPIRAKVGRARRTVANKLYDSAETAGLMQRINAGAFIDPGNTGIQNNELRNKLLRVEAPKAKTTVSFKTPDMARLGGGCAEIKGDAFRSSVTQGDIRSAIDSSPKEYKKFLKKLTGRGDKYVSAITVDKGIGLEKLAHELGHAQGHTAGGLRGYISRTDPRHNGHSEYGGIISYSPRQYKAKSAEEIKFKSQGLGLSGASDSMGQPKPNVSFGEALRDTISNVRTSGHMIAEEAAATRSGLKMLKRHGATKAEMEAAGRSLGYGGSTYLYGGKQSVLSSLGRLVDIPSRRGVSGNGISITR